MKYVFVIAFAAILGFATANPTAAQDRGRSDDEVVVRDRGNGRGATGGSRGRTDDDVERRRRGSGDVERRSTGRTVEDILEGRNKDGNDRRRDDDDWDDRRRRNGDWDDDDWDDDDYRDRRDRRGGPAFCRSGKGHPVHGREWCRDKGFGLGGYDNDDWERRRRYDDWESRRIEDIFFPSRRNSRYMSGSLLENVLGRVIYSQLGSHARRLRADGPIRGRWNGDSELGIYAGDVPFARFVDLNNDRRADIVYIRK